MKSWEITGSLKKQPSPTDIRRAVTLLKKYQVVEPLDLLEDLNGDSRLIIYPCINVVLFGDDVRCCWNHLAKEKITMTNQRFEALSRICLNNWHYINRKTLSFNREINFLPGIQGVESPR